MALRIKPPGEDGTLGLRAHPVPFQARGMPPDVDRTTPDGVRGTDTLDTNPLKGTEFEEAGIADTPSQAMPDPAIDFLRLTREAEEQALLYTNQANRKNWSRAFMAWHNEHFQGSKYTKPDWRNRSKLFIPKTRSGVRKDMAAVSASLFNTLDAITCLPGNDADPMQRGAAAVMEALVNYRTDRTSGQNAIPWFQVAMGARQDAMLTGICLSKQYWKLELKKKTIERTMEDPDNPGVTINEVVEKWSPRIDRPDMIIFPPENFVIDPAAEWTNPAQTAAYIILKYPMRFDDIKRRQESPVNPWNPVPEEQLRTTTEASKYDMAALRRAREQGLDRLDETQTGYEFQIIWVYEVFMRTAGEDWTFISAGTNAFLTDPRPVAEVYPEQDGERPLALGYGSLEAHRIFPMSPVESWQPLQIELNDIRNLALDATKQNVMPISKVKRGRQIDIDQVRRRSYGSSIIVTDPTDVTWETPPTVPQSVPMMNRDLSLEFDDLAGQFNAGTTEGNNALSRTLGGLKLVAGSANAVQEFDIRVWLYTWIQPALGQLVKLEQYYENDPVILGICGDRAKLFQKHGINRITDELLEQEVTIRVSIGLGAGDPQARLQKFTTAANIAAPLIAQSPDFQQGKMEIDVEAVINEIFGAAGYADGGKRFFKPGEPKPNPMGDLPAQKLMADIEKSKKQGRAAILNAIAALAKANIGDRALENDNANAYLDAYLRAQDMGHQHAHGLHDRLLAAAEHGHRHGLAIADHRHQVSIDHADMAHQVVTQQQQAEQAAADRAAAAAGEGGGGGQPAPAAAPGPAAQPEQPATGAAPDEAGILVQALEKLRRPYSTQVRFTRDAAGRIDGAQVVYSRS